MSKQTSPDKKRLREEGEEPSPSKRQKVGADGEEAAPINTGAAKKPIVDDSASEGEFDHEAYKKWAEENPDADPGFDDEEEFEGDFLEGGEDDMLNLYDSEESD